MGLAAQHFLVLPARSLSLWVLGSPITVTASATDPSSADTAAGFTYAWDVTKVHGTTTTTHYASGSAATFSFTPNDDGCGWEISTPPSALTPRSVFELVCPPTSTLATFAPSPPPR